MRRWRIAAAALAAACSSAAPPTPAATPAPARPATRVTDVFVAVGGSFSPQTGEAALRAFVPEVAPVDSGGECNVLRTAGSGATIVTAYFPKRIGAQSLVSLTFDSAGHLARYSERRGVSAPIRTVGMTNAQRDSTLRAATDAVRNTTITFDYAIDQAMVMNRGGGKPIDAVLATVRAVEKLDKLGPPVARLERVRRLCGV